MHNVKVTLLRASGKLEPFIPLISRVTDTYLPTLDEVLSLAKIDIVICDDAARAIPEMGVGGMAYNQHLAHVYINPEFPNLDAVLALHLRSALAHELYHIVRWQKRGYEHTLLESLIAEGLADHFDSSINKTQPKPWSCALSERDLAEYREKAQKIWHTGEYNHAEWFFGQGDIPRWTGYALGYSLVAAYLQQHPQSDYQTLASLPANDFIA